MEGRLRTKTLQNGTVSRLQARAALSPLWGSILASLAECVLRGAKWVVVFEPEHSFLKTIVVFEREQLYRPSGDTFWPVWQNASPEGRQTPSRSKTSAVFGYTRCRSKTSTLFAPLRTPSAKMARMGPQRGNRAALARRRLTVPFWSIFVRRRLSISPP